jgi:U3 small nucleolar RNA-associated protein 22
MVNREAFLLVDLVVTMPSSIFQEKDYLNYRYFYKRAYYLACLAAGLKDDEKGEEDHFDLSFDYLNGNCLQAVLIVKAGKSKSAANLN